MHCHLNVFCKCNPGKDPIYSFLVQKTAELGKAGYSPKMFELVVLLNGM